MEAALSRRALGLARHPATLVAVVLAAAFGVAVLVHPDTWATFTALAAGDRETVRDMLLGFGAFAPIASILLNVAQAVVAPVPGFVVPFVNGVVFGTWEGMLITWIGGIAAASTCFWISRKFGARFAERFCSESGFAKNLNDKLERHAFIAIVMARLVPGVPFDFLSYFVGLTKVPYRAFVVATAIGSAPHAFLYAYMGSSLEIPLWMGILMTPALGLAYAGGKRVYRLVRPATAAIEAATSPESVREARAVAVNSLASWTYPAFPACTNRRHATVATWAASPPIANLSRSADLL